MPWASWRWKVGGRSQVLALSLSWDIFFADECGAVHWLDTGDGCIERVAQTEEEFWQILANPTRAGELLLQPVVESFRQSHGPFPAGKCLSYKRLPVFGGEYSGDNRVLIAASQHFSVTGHFHEQIDGLPDGARIKFTFIE